MRINRGNVSYRKDIDGLRAVSILLVVFYHLQCKFVLSGFVGVDIFFVISGYLITSKILYDIQQNIFSFKSFYLARIKRILPALAVVLFLVSIAVYFLFYPTDIRLYAHSLIAALFFTSNLYFWRYEAAAGYFSIYAGKMPLLHTWSLGIEEQFYIFWPLFIYFLCKHNKNIYLPHLTILFAFFSFLCYLVFRHDVNFVYYSPATRAFELLLGATVAIYYNHIDFSKYTYGCHIGSLCAVMMMVVPGCLFHPSYFVSAYILFPCIGAALFILFGKKQDSLGNKLLSNPITVFFGLISYSLYLWHWPIIVFVNYLGITLNSQVDLMIFSVSVLLSTLTWISIEKPFRFWFKMNFREVLLLLLLTFWLPETAFSLVVSHDPQLGYNAVPTGILKYLSFYGPLKKEYHCFNEGRHLVLPLEKNCLIGKTGEGARAQVLLTGDSHAMSYAGMLNVLLRNAGLTGYVFTWYQMGYMHHPQQYQKFVEQLIQTKRFKYVVIARWWSSYHQNKKNGVVNYDQISRQLKELLSICQQYRVTPVIVFDFPPLLLVNNLCGFSKISSYHCYSREKLSYLRDSKMNRILLALKRRHGNIIFVNPRSVICDTRYCYSSIDRQPIYADGDDNSHLSFSGSELIGRLFLKKYQNPFNRLKT